MKERPILFSAPMVRAILEGKKTQTRRIAKVPPAKPIVLPLRHPPKHDAPYFDSYCSEKKTPENTRGMSDRWCWWTADDRPDPLTEIRCPYGIPGDRLWVRETWGLRNCESDPTDWERASVVGCSEDEIREQYHLDYRADWGPMQEGCFWRPAIHMPRWASRISLDVTDVRVERLHDISEEDAKAEGVEAWMDSLKGGEHYEPDARLGAYPVTAFSRLWKVVNGRESWDANPWVWVVEFTRVEAQERAA